MDELKKQILDFVKKYYKKAKINNNKVIKYAGRIYNEEELCNLVDSSLDFWLTGGKYTNRFEQKLSKFLDIKLPSIFVNSGSSANLLAFMTLTSPLLGEKAIKPGDEIITVACAFPTTISPIINFGAIPVFVDVTLPEYNIDTKYLKKALSRKTKAIMIAHTLGNPFNLKEILKFCRANNLWLIEDNCDALGSKYTINGKTKMTGTWGDISSSSFYPAHHMTTGEGGAVYTNNPLLYKIAKSLRDWGRECACPSGVDNLCGHRFDGKFGTLPKGYDHKYVYSHLGYNLHATDMQAAIGVAQLDKLNDFIKIRKENFKYLYSRLKQYNKYLLLPEKTLNSDPSWFGFLITVKNGISRNYLSMYLEKHGVQTRNLFSGNIVRHPCFTNLDKNKYRVINNLKVTDQIMNDSFFVGTYPGLTKKNLDYIVKVIINGLKEQTKKRNALK